MATGATIAGIYPDPSEIADLRAADRLRKKEARQRAAAIYIPPCEDATRRADLEHDTKRWLQWYFNDIFFEPFRAHHESMIDAIDLATTYAGDQAIAAPRGEGKTTIAECVTIAKILSGVLSFTVLFAATSYHARNSLASIKDYIADSERIKADYPEVWYPVAEARDHPQLAHSMVAYGDDFPIAKIGFQWSGDEITMPRVPGSRCAGSIIATRGLDSAVLGMKKGTRRPQLAIIDDPDTEDTIRSEEQRDKIEDHIDRAIAGLAPRGKRMSRVMLTTTRNRMCVSFRYTSPEIKPSWNGKRFAFIAKFPDRQDLWDEYVSFRGEGMMAGDPFARKAHAFYLAHRQEMDAGAEVTNPLSFDGRKLLDGSQLQVSALQHYYDFLADYGLGAALSELQNNPPEEEQSQSSELSSYRIQRQVSGFAYKEIPPDCAFLTQGIDVRKIALHWVVRAWRVDENGQLVAGYTIDYNPTDVIGTHPGSDEGLDEALVRALHDRKEWIEQHPYETKDGQQMPVQLTLVDAGWRTEAIYRFCREAGLAYRPAMGFGKSSGCASARFVGPIHSTQDKRSGDHWFLSRRPGGVWLVCTDADHWKNWEHDRWRSDPTKPGALLLFGESSHQAEHMSRDEKRHMVYAKHITAEQEVEEVKDGRLVRKFKSKSDNNHYLDASYMSDVAASMQGMRLVGQKAGVVVAKISSWAEWFGDR